MKVFYARYPLHSRQSYNFAPDSVFEIARPPSGLKDKDALSALKGFYDAIELFDEKKVQLKKVTENLDNLEQRLEIIKPDTVGTIYQETLQYPSLNIRGLNAALVKQRSPHHNPGRSDCPNKYAPCTPI